MSVRNFISRRNKSYNTVIRGLGSLVDTPSKLGQVIGNYAIRNFSLRNDGEDIYCNITGNYTFTPNAFSAENPQILFDNVKPMDLAPILLSWEDYAGNIVNLQSEFSFYRSAIEFIHFPNLKTMGSRDLYDMWNIKTANLGQLQNLDIRGFGRDTDLIFDCPSTVTNLILFSQYGSTYFTPSSFENVVTIPTNSTPFNDSPDLIDLASFDTSLFNTIVSYSGRSLFYAMYSLEGNYSFKALTNLNTGHPFYKCYKITGLDLRNVTEITGEKAFYNSGQAMVEIDLRSCATINVSEFIFNDFKTGCTYHLNSALQDYDGNGTMHPQIQFLIDNKNPNIIWY